VVWIQYERLYTYNEMLVNQLLPSNFHAVMAGQFVSATNTIKGKMPNKYELFSLTKIFMICQQAAKAAAAAALSEAKNEKKVAIEPPLPVDVLTPVMLAARNNSIRWVPMHQLKRTYILHFLSNVTVSDMNSKKLPLATYFYLDWE